MKQLVSLLKKDINRSLGLIKQIPKNFKDKKIRNLVVQILILLPLAILYGNIVFTTFDKMFDAASIMNRGIYLAYFLGIAYVGLSLFFNTQMIIGDIYDSNDVKIMLNLPIKVETILESKILYQSLNNLLTALIFIVPTLVNIGIKSASSFLYYPAMLLAVLFFTVINMSLINLIIVGLVGVFSRVKNFRNKLKYINMFLVIAAILAFQMVPYENLSPDNLINLTMAYGKYYPAIILFGNAVFSQDIITRVLALLLLALIAVILFFLVPRLLANAFRRSIIAENSGSTKKRRSISIASGQVFLDIAKKEINDIFKTPIYFFNIAIVGLIVPVAMLLPILKLPEDAKTALITFSGYLSRIPLDLKSAGIALLVGFILAIFLAGSGQASTTAITREGKNLWILRTLPIKPYDIINGKLLASSFFQLINMLPVTVLIAVFGKIRLSIVLISVVAMIVAAFYSNVTGLLVDILFPKLVWDNPQQAIKQNFVTVIFVFADMGLSFLIGFLFFKGYDIGIITLDNIIYFILGLILAFLLVALITYSLLGGILTKKLRKY